MQLIFFLNIYLYIHFVGLGVTAKQNINIQVHILYSSQGFRTITESYNVQ